MVNVPFLALAPIAILATGVASTPVESRDADASNRFFNIILYSDAKCSKLAKVDLVQLYKDEGCVQLLKSTATSFQFVLDGGTTVKNATLKTYRSGKLGCDNGKPQISIPGHAANQGKCYGDFGEPIRTFAMA